MIFIRAIFLVYPHDKFKKKTYKNALNIVDVASRYKGSYQLTTKNSKEVSQAFQWIYENTPLTYPKTLIVEWVSRLQNVVSALNNEKTRLIGMKPVDAIKETL